MSSLRALVQGELLDAQTAQDQDRILLLTSVLTEIRNREIELGRDLTDDDVVAVLRRAIRRRRESMELHVQSGQPALAEMERREAATLERWLPGRDGTREELGSGP